VLKRSYSRLVKFKIRNGINYIDKLNFLEVYPTVRIEAFKSETIKNSFGAAGLVPFTPDRVISKLDIQLRTPTPPPSRGSDLSRNFTPKTPYTEKELRRQASSIKALLRTRSRSPPSPSNRALNQLIKGFQLLYRSLIFTSSIATVVRRVAISLYYRTIVSNPYYVSLFHLSYLRNYFFRSLSNRISISNSKEVSVT
jgi:hypothetical protein